MVGSKIYADGCLKETAFNFPAEIAIWSVSEAFLEWSKDSELDN
jgi:hypothetical protein